MARTTSHRSILIYWDKQLGYGRHMADAKALFTQRFDAARAAWTQGDEPAAAESLHSAIIAARSDPSLRRELASALFNLGKLSRKFGPAGEAAAEGFLTEALAISEELFGDEDAGETLGSTLCHSGHHWGGHSPLGRFEYSRSVAAGVQSSGGAEEFP